MLITVIYLPLRITDSSSLDSEVSIMVLFAGVMLCSQGDFRTISMIHRTVVDDTEELDDTDAQRNGKFNPLIRDVIEVPIVRIEVITNQVSLGGVHQFNRYEMELLVG